MAEDQSIHDDNATNIINNDKSNSSTTTSKNDDLLKKTSKHFQKNDVELFQALQGKFNPCQINISKTSVTH